MTSTHIFKDLARGYWAIVGCSVNSMSFRIYLSGWVGDATWYGWCELISVFNDFVISVNLPRCNCNSQIGFEIYHFIRRYL